MMHEALAGGEALRGLCGSALACATACEARPDEADELIKAASAERELLSLVLAVDGSKTRALLPAKDALGLKVEDVCVLSDAVSAFLLAAAAAPKERGGLRAEVAAQVTESLNSMRRYVGELSESFFAHERVVATGGPAVLRASFCLLARFPKSYFAQTIGTFLMNGTNGGDFNDSFLQDAGSVSSLLDAISSTTHDDDTLDGLISAISNICGMEGAAGDTASRAFAEGGVFSFLQPPLLSSNSFIVSTTAFAIATLARREVLSEYVEKAELTPVLLDVLHALPYGAVKGITMWGRADAANLAALLTASTHPELQLSVLHIMASAVVGSYSAESIAFFAKTPAILAGLRVAASSGDAFVYSGAAFVLHHMTEAVPVYRQRAAEASALAEPAEAWSIESVAAWVVKQPFRAYKRAFAENLITGRVLLTLSEEDLANTLGVTNALHRRTILFAIGDLGGAHHGLALVHSPASSGGGGGGGSGSGAGGAAASPSAVLSPSRSLARAASSDGEMYDVFLSYRRLGGADFAQLLKLLLKGEGLNVFLDTENLGTGNFQEQLVTSLRRSKNVVLVWSKGCMDRFLDDADQTTADFVRLEYKHAISMAKNIIPCYKEDFSFPAAERVPADIRDVMSMNAVKWIGEYRDASLKKLIDALRL